MMRPLAKGEVGVQDQFTGLRRIVSDSTLRLVDRSLFVRGDICKKTRSEDAQSGAVLNVHVQIQVRHAITNMSVDAWFEREEFRPHQSLLLGDYVLCENWIGQVEEVFNEALMVSPTAQMQPVYELGGRFSVGDKCFPLPEPDQHTEKPKEPTDIIVKVTPVAAAISWSAVNQSLDPSQAQHIPRPKRFWSVNDFPRVSIMRGRGPVVGTIGERVLFKDPAKAFNLGILPVIYSESDSKNQITVDALMITNTRTRVEVLWQDGSREWIPATDLVPNLSADDYECWPGDFVLWKGEEEKKVAIVQSVSFKDRIASVRWLGTEGAEAVPMLELDPLGSSIVDERQLSVFGLRRGEHVLLHKSGTTNGLSPPLVPKVGELEEWVHEVPSRAADGTMEGWRGELTNVAVKGLGFDISRKSPTGTLSSVQMSGDLIGQIVDVLATGEPGRLAASSTGEPSGIDWFGEVVDLTLNGDVVVELPSSERVVVPIERCSLYRDSDDDQWDGDEALGDPLESTGSVEGEMDYALNADVLPQSPVDHAFYSVEPVQPSKNFMSRLAKEYRALESSLPDSILVRAYEDRADLLRSLIIGPSNTPYEDAPFVIDWRLDSSFPQAPPIAHFLSWTNGNGRVNPNLYEEGKVCLSILGTWAGDKNESWNPARSSLLQALVSIQGLVLVKEPYFCEPSFEKMRGTEEGTINSRLYSEKAYVLSRGFVRRALEIPLQNLEDEIGWFYYKRGNLEKVIKDSNALITRSLQGESNADTMDDAAISRLSAGGILSLKRMLNKLQQILDARE
ncbi:hypothetical protein FRC20_002096 [Serendipita sp. 405]|nr:hypothetical protein FRC20_002096 [Serendipita sp. 405]